MTASFQRSEDTNEHPELFLPCSIFSLLWSADARN